MAERPGDFQAPWWLRHSHVQTVVPHLDPRRYDVASEHVRHELPDGDFADVHWLNREGTGPLFILLPGMQGTPSATYIRSLLWELSQRGLRAAVLCHRGGAVPNRRAQFYHAGFTEHLAWLVAFLHAREPHTPLYAVGFSLGGSMVIRYLAETGHASHLSAAAAVSLTFSLSSTARRACEGINQLYQLRVLRSYQRVARLKAHLPEYTSRLGALKGLRSIRDFDDVFTAPLHGFEDAEDYYQRCSSRQFLSRIETPFLILNAEDDPLVARDTLPAARELREHVRLELTPHGGHLGFMYRWSSGLCYYPPSRLISFFLQEQREAHESLSQAVVGHGLLALEAADARGGTGEHARAARAAQ
ncbi:YheT family hydrolase [Pyxidicoccus xibeiensis]|uniref:YheT family hydrolase n=1 Tax=Pyxidicoccus xibeiensis TaxID=2906759 RepID=UPI0020A72DCD|nr:alpha/beta fold hydrolase [Pyxidicoccus xibeiensis]MCP3135975.1 alpha/beta fold hydrolase [Pyxidicoccus xibeiensis]